MLFSEIHRLHEGNSADKWQSYLDVYDQLLLPFQQRNIDLLEVEVCYFPNV